jgi:hypothetical protein
VWSWWVFSFFSMFLNFLILFSLWLNKEIIRKTIRLFPGGREVFFLNLIHLLPKVAQLGPCKVNTENYNLIVEAQLFAITYLNCQGQNMTLVLLMGLGPSPSFAPSSPGPGLAPWGKAAQAWLLCGGTLSPSFPEVLKLLERNLALSKKYFYWWFGSINKL